MHRHIHLVALGMVAASAILVGCRSIGGHMIAHDKSGNVIGVKDVKGLPISVQRPTMGVFILTETTYDVTRKITSVDAGGNVSTRSERLGEVVEAALTEQPIYMGPSQIYTIDPKRPAAGTLDYAIELENQYPTKLTGKLEDKTIAELRETLKAMAEVALQAMAPTPGVPDKESGTTVTLDRVVTKRRVSLVTVDLLNGTVEVTEL